MVNIQLYDMNTFLRSSKGKKIACYGAGKYLMDFMLEYKEDNIIDFVTYIIDSNIDICGKEITVLGKRYIVSSILYLKQIVLAEKNIIILITSINHYMEILQGLDECREFDGIITFLAPFIEYGLNERKEILFYHGEAKIPKIIHYCWFGHNRMNDKYLKCLDSWKHYCPDYQIVKWDENNYDYKKIKYMKQAYEMKKWAFVSDYVRLDVVNSFGGIYLDCDVELLKNLDELLCNDLFCGFESYRIVAFGLGFGAVRNHELLIKLLELYNDMSFVDEEGNLNMTTCPIYQSKMIKEFGIALNNTYQSCNGITVYPTEFFSPISYLGMGKITDNSFSIHHYAASWVDKEMRNNRLHQDAKKLFYRFETGECLNC